jgi:four helix bundle protein
MVVRMGGYRQLIAWQAAHELAVEVYRVTSMWPTSERYGLVAQIRRAAFSAPANIAEGSARRGPREFRRFVHIALGSISEVEYTVDFALAVEVASQFDATRLAPLIRRAGFFCYRLARSLTPHVLPSDP